MSVKMSIDSGNNAKNEMSIDSGKNAKNKMSIDSGKNAKNVSDGSERQLAVMAIAQIQRRW